MCSQLFLALDESVSVKVVLYKRFNLSPVLCSIPLMKPHKVLGQTFGDQKLYRLVC